MLRNLDPLAACTALKTFNLSQCDGLDSIQALQFCTSLTSLDMDKCSRSFTWTP